MPFRQQLQESLKTLENSRFDVQFLMKNHKKGTYLPIEQQASGGELSRILFALKKSSTIKAKNQLMVLDEIDAGLSGKTANLLGFKLQEMAKKQRKYPRLSGDSKKSRSTEANKKC